MEAKLYSYTILRFWQYFLISEDPKYYIVRQSLWRLANKVLSNSYKFVFTKALKFPKHYARDCKSSARVFTKILKIPIFLLRNICIRVILRFDDMLTICWRYVDILTICWFWVTQYKKLIWAGHISLRQLLKIHGLYDYTAIKFAPM